MKLFKNFVRFVVSHREKTKNLFKNIFLLGSANFIEQILFFILYVWIARKFDPQQYGYFFTALVFSRIAFRISEFGINTVITRDISRNHELAPSYLGNIFTLRGFICVMTLFLIQPLIYIIGYEHPIIISVEFLSIYIIIWGFSQSIGAAFRGLERQDIVALIIVSGIIPLFMLLGLALMAGTTIHTIEFLFILGAGIQLYVGYMLMTHLVGKFKLSYDIGLWKKTLKDSLPLGLAGMFALVYFRIDTLILSFYFPQGKIVGLYNTAYNIFVALTFLPFIFYQIALPLFSRLALKSLSKLRSYYYYSLFGIGLCAFSISAAVFFCAKPLTFFVYGEKYLASVEALKILSPASILTSLGFVSMSVLTALNLSKKLLKATFVAVITNIVLNLILIPHLGMTGAAVNTIITEGTFFAICSRDIALFFNRAQRADYCVSLKSTEV
ncbi:MAG: flippase [Candidatus Aminicenantes bacterium]|nr:flippase [Candidatus Aminicenantes bacterium]